MGHAPFYLYFNEICAFISFVPFTWEQPSSASAPFVIPVWGYRSREEGMTFFQALTALDCPLLFKTGALPYQKSHPWESRQREIQPILVPETPELEVVWAPFTSPMPGSVLSRGLLEAAAHGWGDGCFPPASWFCCAGKQGSLGCSLHVNASWK